MIQILVGWNSSLNAPACRSLSLQKSCILMMENEVVLCTNIQNPTFIKGLSTKIGTKFIIIDRYMINLLLF
jgi:hypothetical protein